MTACQLRLARNVPRALLSMPWSWSCSYAAWTKLIIVHAFVIEQPVILESS